MNVFIYTFKTTEQVRWESSQHKSSIISRTPHVTKPAFSLA